MIRVRIKAAATKTIIAQTAVTVSRAATMKLYSAASTQSEGKLFSQGNMLILDDKTFCFNSEISNIFKVITNQKRMKDAHISNMLKKSGEEYEP